MSVEVEIVRVGMLALVMWVTRAAVKVGMSITVRSLLDPG